MKKLPIVLLAMIIVSCAGGTGTEGTSMPVTTPPGESAPSTGGPVPVPVDATEPDGDAGIQVPVDVVTAAVSAASEDTGLDPDQLTPVRAQQVVWSDGSLGCPQQGQSYIQVLTDGYWVILQAPDGELDYRASLELDFRRCLDGQAPQSTVADR